jgi:hypothetical protein
MADTTVNQAPQLEDGMHGLQQRGGKRDGPDGAGPNQYARDAGKIGTFQREPSRGRIRGH